MGTPPSTRADYIEAEASKIRGRAAPVSFEGTRDATQTDLQDFSALYPALLASVPDAPSTTVSKLLQEERRRCLDRMTPAEKRALALERALERAQFARTCLVYMNLMSECGSARTYAFEDDDVPDLVDNFDDDDLAELEAVPSSPPALEADDSSDEM